MTYVDRYGPDQVKAIKMLWSAVLLRAFSDATSYNVKSDAGHAQTVAHTWLTADVGVFRRDRHLVCELAGIDPSGFDRAIRTRGVKNVARLVYDKAS